MRMTLAPRLRRLSTSAVAVAALLASTLATAQPAAPDELLFMSNRSNSTFEFYRMTAEGARVQRVLPERGEVEGMTWSPDGLNVLYAAARQGQHQNIFVTSVTDGRTRQLTQDKLPASEPTWSPDSRTIAFVSMRDGGRKVYLMDADGGNVRRLTAAPGDDESSPTFSADGTRVAYLASNDKHAPRVSVAHLGKGQSGVVSQNAERTIEGAPVWSPDGSHLLFGVKKGEGVQLVLMRADGSERRQVTATSARSGQPQWSPDGKQVLFLSVPGDEARQSVFVMNADGSSQRKLKGTANDIMDARWSADGRRIYFVEQLPSGGQIFSMDRQGQDLRRLSASEGFDVNIQVCCSRPAARLASSQ